MCAVVGTGGWSGGGRAVRGHDGGRVGLDRGGTAGVGDGSGHGLGALPEAVRDGIVTSDAHIGAVFHSLQLSATGRGSGLANVAGLGDLGERADAALRAAIPQLRAEMDRSFVINR